MVPDAIFCMIAIIPMARPKKAGYGIIGLGSGILIFNQNHNRGSGGLALEYPGNQDGAIRFFSGGAGYPALPWFSSVKGFLQNLFIQIKPWGAALNDDTDSFSMGFPKGRDIECLAKTGA
jgi:hypothetical protein